MDIRKDNFMESVINMIIENELNKKSKPKKVDRIVLDSESVETIKNIMSQVESQLGSLIQVSPKLIGNFILKKRAALLTTQELEELRAENHDVIKALKMAMAEAVKAKQNGSEVDLNLLLKNIQTPSVNLDSVSKKRRGRRKKSLDSNLQDQLLISPIVANPKE